MIPGAEKAEALSALNFVSDWIVNSAFWSVQTLCNFIYSLWLDIANVE